MISGEDKIGNVYHKVYTGFPKETSPFQEESYNRLKEYTWLGCMGFSHASGDPKEKSTAVKILREAYEIGYDFFDTAEAYTGVSPDGTVSYNEELVGEAVRGIRDQVVIATKMGVHHNEDRSLRFDSSPETMAQLTKEGKIRCWGISEATEDYLRRASVFT